MPLDSKRKRAKQLEKKLKQKAKEKKPSFENFFEKNREKEDKKGKKAKRTALWQKQDPGEFRLKQNASFPARTNLKRER